MYLGNQPALSYTSFAKQDFTTSATTSYTLDNPVTNANELALFINFVRQEPTTAYSASGTSLTLTSATSASDDMYCVFLGKAVQTVNPPNGSVGLSQLSATGTPSSSTFLRGDNSWVAAGGANTPAFSVKLSGDQNVSDSAATKIAFNTEILDTNNAFDNSTNYRFTVPAGEGGNYAVGIFMGAYNNNGAVSEVNNARAMIYKNGSIFFNGDQSNSNNPTKVEVVTTLGVLPLVAGDYIEFYALIDTASNNPAVIGINNTYAYGYKLIG